MNIYKSINILTKLSNQIHFSYGRTRKKTRTDQERE